MKFRFLTLSFILIYTIFTTSCSEIQTVEKFQFNENEYQQSFFDDFTAPTLNSEKWEKCPEWQRQDLGGYWNNECSYKNYFAPSGFCDLGGYWNDECSYIKDGNLIIECKKDGDSLLSGAIRTKNKFEQAEGLFKFRFKAEKSSGLWYAIWLMCDEEKNIGNGATDGAEINIIEIIANDPWEQKGKKQYINSAVHWDDYEEGIHQSKGSKYYIDDNFFNEWHECIFLWESTGYKLYLDETLIWNAKGSDYGGTSTIPTYIKITAEFGKRGGEIQEELLPAKMYVDYIAAYKKK